MQKITNEIVILIHLEYTLMSFYIDLTTFSACIREIDPDFKLSDLTIDPGFELGTFCTWTKDRTHCAEPLDI